MQCCAGTLTSHDGADGKGQFTHVRFDHLMAATSNDDLDVQMNVDVTPQAELSFHIIANKML